MIIGFIGITNTSINLISNLILTRNEVEFLIIDNNFLRLNQIIEEFNSIIDYGRHKNKINFTNYQNLEKADILIIEPKQNQAPGMNLTDQAIENAEWIYKTGFLVRNSNFNGITFILGYYNSILCKIFSSTSGLVGKKVFGIGTILENIYFNMLLKKTNSDLAKTANLLILGDQGNSFLINQDFKNNEITDKNNKIFDKLIQKINEKSLEKIIRKTAENWLLASILLDILLDIFQQKQSFFLINSWVESFYNIKNDFFTIPVKIDLSGQIETKNINLNKQDQQKLIQFMWKKDELNTLIDKYLLK
ncbi:lactate dehydrogenase [Mesomycoplasma hyopneumoniae]|uniref:L-lactate dehydrogenase n=2 Tax=Mesomycoplasma hyopneumoniae (strain 168) TaxID=907287 RepID=E4QTC8_MESH1|nr:lactate dehydrogenase [Mesomycoplasma hyopneumoniae]ADQ90677.1 L-lactate dehydrogenase [Mesomycoplasma hyopneumoniae 168]AGM22253.1 L-lactate dehydrogenase [Mesomycoplasma hyopneumoniae 168-L]OWY74097.1 lactate dehydrogenase [Mesomycoplasma hyopneumoniae]